MVTFKAHFDGGVIHPDEPVDLPAGAPVLVTVLEPQEAPSGQGRFSDLAGRLTPEEADEMERLIDDEFERIEGEW